MRPIFQILLLLAILAGGSLPAQQAPSPGAPAAAEAPQASQARPTLAKELANQMTREKAVQFIEIVKKGGWVMYPMAALSFTMVLLIIYYALTIRQGNIVSDKFMNAADALIRKQDYLGLIAVCNRENEAIARITYKTLDFATKNPTASFDEIREVTEAEGSRQASILNQRITYLADVGSVAPLVGLLGTVTGMIRSFHDLSAATGAVQSQVGAGVSEALIATAGGLSIGIPALIFHSIFRGRVQMMISELEAAMTHLMALLAAQNRRTSYRAPGRTDSPEPGPKASRRGDPKGI